MTSQSAPYPRKKLNDKVQPTAHMMWREAIRLKTILEVSEQFLSDTKQEREQTIRALLEQYLENALAQADDE